MIRQLKIRVYVCMLVVKDLRQRSQMLLTMTRNFKHPSIVSHYYEYWLKTVQYHTPLIPLVIAKPLFRV